VIANLAANKGITRKVIEENSSLIEGSPLVVIDANLANEVTESIIYLCHQAHVPIFMEPTDVAAIPNLVECLKRVRGQNRDSLNSLLCNTLTELVVQCNYVSLRIVPSLCLYLFPSSRRLRSNFALAPKCSCSS